jgi:hypothetical protein
MSKSIKVPEQNTDPEIKCIEMKVMLPVIMPETIMFDLANPVPEKLMTRLSPHYFPVKFVISEKNRCVVAYVCHPPEIKANAAAMGPVDTGERFFPRLTPKIENFFKIRAIARCSDKDVFDPEIGRKLAFLRLRRKIVSKYITGVACLINNISDLFTSLLRRRREDFERTQHVLDNLPKPVKKKPAKPVKKKPAKPVKKKG